MGFLGQVTFLLMATGGISVCCQCLNMAYVICSQRLLFDICLKGDRTYILLRYFLYTAISVNHMSRVIEDGHSLKMDTA